MLKAPVKYSYPSYYYLFFNLFNYLCSVINIKTIKVHFKWVKF
jgi:hypothetical protein